MVFFLVKLKMLIKTNGRPTNILLPEKLQFDLELNGGLIHCMEQSRLVLYLGLQAIMRCFFPLCYFSKTIHIVFTMFLDAYM